MNYIFEEKVYIPFIFVLISLVVLVFMIYLLIFPSSIPEENPPFWLLGLICLILIFTIVNFSYLKIVVDEQKILVNFGLFKKRIWIKNIEKLEFQKVSFLKFGGYGLRFSRDKVMGFVAQGGVGIQFIDKNDQKKYFISTQKAEQLIDILINYGAKKA